MKKNVLLAIAVIFGSSVYGQFYTSFSGGYGFETAKKVLGQQRTDTGVSDLKGSYGEGFQAQLRGGYLFTKRFGAELAVGYLHGKDVQTNKNRFVDMKARGRAFGLSLSAVYNITDNLYVRAGGVTKIGGTTEVITQLTTEPLFPAKVNFQTNFYGKVPFGFIAGVGYDFKVTDKISIFVEGEYLNINVERKTSKLHSFEGTYKGGSIGRDQKNTFLNGLGMLQHAPLPQEAKAAVNALVTQLTPLLADEYDWSGSNQKAPYSSLGLNFGVKYRF